MSVSQQNPDGSWSPSQPVPLSQDFDVEVYGRGPWRWEAHRGIAMVASGRARTRIGLYIALRWARLRTAKRGVQ